MCLGQGVRRIETFIWRNRLTQLWAPAVLKLTGQAQQARNLARSCCILESRIHRADCAVLCLVAQSCPTLCHPRDCSCQAPLSLQILQARTSRLETQAEFLFHSPKANSLLWGRSASALKTFSQLEETAPKSWRIMCFSLSLMTVNVNHFRKILQYEKHSHSNI